MRFSRYRNCNFDSSKVSFVHQFLAKQQIERIDGLPEGRRYRVPSGNLYPSVTSVIDKFKDSTALDNWKQRVGEQEATRIANQAKTRGSEVHKLCEKYLLNDLATIGTAMPFNLAEFNKLRRHLNEHVDIVYGIEHMLYSDRLKVAGTTDVICNWDGVPSIVDFKTSRYPKTADQIQHYFLQATIYSMMVGELYSLDVPNIVILMSVDHDSPIVFNQKASNYVNGVVCMFEKINSTEQ